MSKILLFWQYSLWKYPYASFNFIDDCPCKKIEVYYNSKSEKYNYVPEIFGHYIRIQEVINEHNSYLSEDHNGSFGIWWCNKKWRIGPIRTKGQCLGYAKLDHDFKCPLNYTSNWMLYHGLYEGWKDSGKGLSVRCNSLEKMSTQDEKAKTSKQTQTITAEIVVTKTTTIQPPLKSYYPVPIIQKSTSLQSSKEGIIKCFFDFHIPTSQIMLKFPKKA